MYEIRATFKSRNMAAKYKAMILSNVFNDSPEDYDEDILPQLTINKDGTYSVGYLLDDFCIDYECAREENTIMIQNAGLEMPVFEKTY